MYLSEKEKYYKDSIDKIAERTGLTVVYYISDGNRVDILYNGYGILFGLNFETAYYAIYGIAHYKEAIA